MTRIELLQAHLRGAHAPAPDGACEACQRVQAAQPASTPTATPRKARARAGAGRCECCGTECGPKSRFAPGHDAKLKSRLYVDARSGSVAAWTEMELRQWVHLVDSALVPTRAKRGAAALLAELDNDVKVAAFISTRVSERQAG